MKTNVFFFFLHVAKSVLIVEVSSRCEPKLVPNVSVKMYYQIIVLLKSCDLEVDFHASAFIQFSCMSSLKISNCAISAVNLNLLLIPGFVFAFFLRQSLTQERLWKPFWSTWRPMSPRWSRSQGEPDCRFSTYGTELWYFHSRFGCCAVVTWERCVELVFLMCCSLLVKRVPSTDESLTDCEFCAFSSHTVAA